MKPRQYYSDVKAERIKDFRALGLSWKEVGHAIGVGGATARSWYFRRYEPAEYEKLKRRWREGAQMWVTRNPGLARQRNRENQWKRRAKHAAAR